MHKFAKPYLNSCVRHTIVLLKNKWRRWRWRRRWSATSHCHISAFSFNKRTLSS